MYVMLVALTLYVTNENVLILSILIMSGSGPLVENLNATVILGVTVVTTEMPENLEGELVHSGKQF